jgi:Circularly permutated YpsA SLOG family
VTFPAIISGAETGAESAAHDFAVENELECAGWCLNGPNAECAEKNVLHSNATVIFTLSAKPGKRARLTVKLAQKHQKPWLHIHQKTQLPGMMLVSLITSNRVARLNVAGSTASEESAIGKFVLQVLEQACGFLLDRETGNY